MIFCKSLCPEIWTLTGPLTIGANKRLDVRGDNAASTFANLNGYGITKKGTAQFGFTQTTVTNDQGTAFIDIKEGNVTLEEYATLSGGASNHIDVRNGAYFDLHNIRNPINWALNLDNGARIYTRAGGGTNFNVIAGPVTLGGSATFESGGTFADTYTGVINGTGPLVKTGTEHGITYLRNTNNAWNGGLFRVNGTADTELFNGDAGRYPDVTLYAGGAFVDLPASTMTRSVNNPLRKPQGMGILSIPVATAGSGYIGSPFVSITGAGGKGASAFAHMDRVSGTVTSIEIVSPGIGYTHAPTVTLMGGGATTPATLGTPVLGLSASGGLTKLGEGTLVLNATNTYTGATAVQAGTLRLGSATALSPVSALNVTGGVLDLGGYTISNHSVTASSGTIFNGTLAAAVLDKNGPGTMYLGAALAVNNVPGQGSLTPGLWEGMVGEKWNITTPNPRTGIQLTTRAAIGAVGSNATYAGGLWAGNNHTWIYKGVLWNRGESDVTWRWRLIFVDNALLKIDGNLVKEVTNAEGVVYQDHTLSPGPHAIEIRFGDGSGSVGPGSGLGGVTYDPQARGSTDPLNYILLQDPGDGSLLTTDIESGLPVNTVVNVNEGTLRIATLAGLWEGRIAARWDATSANPATAVELTTTAANGNCGSGGTINGKLWPDNSTYVYSGYIWNRTGADVTWTFAEGFDDQVLLRIDGATVLDDLTWASVSKKTITLSPGAHTFDVRFGQGSGGAGGVVSSWWTDKSYSFGIDFQGRNSDVQANYVVPADNGNGELFTRSLVDSAGAQVPLANATVNLAAGAVLDLNGGNYKVGELTGSGIVSNGTLSAGTVISPAGDAAIGTQALEGVSLDAGVTYRLTVNGALSDRVTSSGALNFSGVTIVPATAAELTERTYVIAHAEGGFSGAKPTFSGFPSKYKIILQGKDMLLTSQFGTLMIIR